MLSVVRAVLWLGFVLSAFAWFGLKLFVDSERRSGTVYFCEMGVVSYTTPSHRKASYGSMIGGMYGNLPRYTKHLGFDTCIVESIPKELCNEDILVIVSLNEELGLNDLKRIWNFVSKGGALWVIGEHTMVSEGENQSNRLLSKTGIKYRHDSLKFIVQGWFYSLRSNGLSPFKHLHCDDQNSMGFLVGASLEVTKPAFPLIEGEYAFSDEGAEKANSRGGYIGDYSYSKGERLGNLVLAAGQYCGKGRVLVYGDTTSFFNMMLSRSHKNLRVALTFLSYKNNLAPILCEYFVCLFSFFGFFLCVVQLYKVKLLCLFGLSFFVLIELGSPSLELLRFGVYDNEDVSPFVVVDQGCLPAMSLNSSNKNGIGGLILNSIRAGKLPLIVDDIIASDLNLASQLYLISPQKELSKKYTNDVIDFLESGGEVFIAAGPSSNFTLKHLFDKYGLKISPVPHGRTFDVLVDGEPASFFSAWSIECSESSLVLARGDDGPIWISRQIGQGVLHLISDPEFFLNKNIESNAGYDPANIKILQKIIN